MISLKNCILKQTALVVLSPWSYVRQKIFRSIILEACVLSSFLSQVKMFSLIHATCIQNLIVTHTNEDLKLEGCFFSFISLELLPACLQYVNTIYGWSFFNPLLTVLTSLSLCYFSLTWRMNTTKTSETFYLLCCLWPLIKIRLKSLQFRAKLISGKRPRAITCKAFLFLFPEDFCVT